MTWPSAPESGAVQSPAPLLLVRRTRRHVYPWPIRQAPRLRAKFPTNHAFLPCFRAKVSFMHRSLSGLLSHQSCRAETCSRSLFSITMTTCEYRTEDFSAPWGDNGLVHNMCDFSSQPRVSINWPHTPQATLFPFTLVACHDKPLLPSRVTIPPPQCLSPIVSHPLLACRELLSHASARPPRTA